MERHHSDIRRCRLCSVCLFETPEVFGCGIVATICCGALESRKVAADGFRCGIAWPCVYSSEIFFDFRERHFLYQADCRLQSVPCGRLVSGERRPESLFSF